MPDITMCCAEYCPYRDTCYRYKAEPDKRQSYKDYSYECNEKSGFESYLPIRRE